MANYTYIEATTQVKNGAGKIKGIFVSAASSTPTITVYDEANGGTTKVLLATFTPAAATFYALGVDGAFANNGLNVAIGGTVKATVIYE
jgi:FtsH-binding integral membrane protein